MASKRTVTTVCDRDRSTNDVRRRTVKLSDEEGGRQLTFDACAECRRTVPLEEWEQLIPSKGTKGRSLTAAPVLDGPRAVARVTSES